ncbi:MAG: UDPGP type 1 family protein [Phycisphaerales bacterium]|nr:UDPGP type 1 family protein [Phycisphaerales bacterium]MCB9862646.1 UDPGP type 1 family protein [Phycisphaerales bacterium]
MTPTRDVQSIRDAFSAAGQDHLFTFWDDLNSDQRDQLLADLAAIRLDALPDLLKIVADTASHATGGSIEPADVITRDDVTAEHRELGESLIRRGKVAPFTVAGGQGTRLGYDGPKGAFRMSPVRNKPLFQLFAESIRATESRYDCELTWYIMTSPINNAATASYFEDLGYFGLNPERVVFFQQGVMPSFANDGKILLAEKHRVALSPDGHGGSLLALAETGMLEDMADRGIDHISYFQVDNPLVYCIDPAFVGLHAASKSEMSSKCVSKADDFERVGNFAVVDGKLGVIEYSDLPEKLAKAKNADGSRKFDAGSIAIHVISRSFVERLTADRSKFGLPWHRANKKVGHVDTASGEVVDPSEPNAVKLEAFIFDALPLSKNPIVLEVDRSEEFSPVKNATGVDSVETSRRDMSRRAARWLKAAGAKIPCNSDGEPTPTCEVSPLAALEADDLKNRAPINIAADKDGCIYLDK